MAEAYTISVSQGDHAEEHSRRSYTPMSADRGLQDQNVTVYDCGDDREHFNDFFRPALESYNARQTRSDRMKSLDYYEALVSGTEGYGRGKQQEKPIYHEVIQIGNRETNGVTDAGFDVEHWRQLKREFKFDEASEYAKQHLNTSNETQDFKEILTELAQEIRDNKDHKYDGILVHGLTIHADEPNGTIHLDMRYTMYTNETGSKRKDGKSNGLDCRVSMNKCLGKLGYKTTKTHTALEQFRDAIKDRLEEKMNERGYQRDIKGEHRKHQPNAVFEAEQEAKKTETRKLRLQSEVTGLQDKVTEAQKVIQTAEETKRELDLRRTASEKAIEEQKQKLDEKTKKDRKFISDFVSGYKALYKEMAGEEFPEGQSISVATTRYAQEKFRERSRTEVESETGKIKATMIENAQRQIERERLAAQQRIQADREEMEKEIDEQRTEIAEQQEALQANVLRLKNAIAEAEELRHDSDISRKRFMEGLHAKGSKSAEEMYQEHLRSEAVERKRKLDHFAEIASQYDQEYGAIDLNSLKRQAGE